MAISGKATQEFVPIDEIRDGIVVLKDGSLRAIVMSSSLNFALKSEDNQQSIIMQFQNFLNSLDFSIQIFVQSRRLDIRPYIALLETRYKEQLGDLMKLQTREYIEFVKNFTENTNIMTKTFFIVIPYSASIFNSNSRSPLDLLKPKKTPEGAKKAKIEDFEEYRSQIEQRVSVVLSGLARCGLRAVQLGTEEVVELFYKIFNPGDTEKPIKVS